MNPYRTAPPSVDIKQRWWRWFGCVFKRNKHTWIECVKPYQTRSVTDEVGVVEKATHQCSYCGNYLWVDYNLIEELLKTIKKLKGNQ